MINFFILIALSMVTFTAQADSSVYYYKDQMGNTVFTDQHSSDSKPVDIKPATINQNNNASTNQHVVISGQPTNQIYTSFDFSSPKDQDTLYNQDKIPVTMNVKPTLLNGDTIQVSLDGKKVSESRETTQVIEIYDRGTHQLSAQIIRNNQVVKQTNPITIYVHRTSILNRG